MTFKHWLLKRMIARYQKRVRKMEDYVWQVNQWIKRDRRLIKDMMAKESEMRNSKWEIEKELGL